MQQHVELSWIEVEESVLAALRTADDIRENVEPTLVQHLAERAGGWPGSDGSSSSPDTVWGLRVGLTTTDFRPDLPTWRHDLGYRVLRRLLAWGQITEEEAEKLRRILDETLLVDLLRAIEAAGSILRPLRRRRALKYYEGVLLGGGRAIRIAIGREAYPRRSRPSVA